MVYAAAAGGYSEERYQAAYVTGVTNLLAALQGQSTLRRLVFVSSTSVYGEHHGDWVDETTPADGKGFAADRLRQGEALIWASQWPATVLRLAGIYGPGRTRLIDSLRRGEAHCTPGIYSNRIHRDDCARALAHILELAQPAALYLGVDDLPVELCEVMHWLAGQLGVAGPEQVSAAERQSIRAAANKRCSNGLLKASGFSLRYPDYQSGYRLLLARS